MPEDSERAELGDLERAMAAMSCAYRLDRLKLKVDGIPFDLSRYPYLYELYDDDESSEVSIMKGAQMGFTTLQVLRTIDRATNVYPRGILYLFPSRDDVVDFSRTRFKRLLDDNPYLRSLIHETDAVNVKRIGPCFIYFRGSRSRTPLKSIPVDCIVYDEFDEMDFEQVELAKERVSGSDFQHHFRLSTPTFPDTAIDYEYNKSDMRRWLVKCRRCNTWNCLEDQFPECLLRMQDGKVLKVCVNCRSEVFTADGEWVPEHPDRTKRGYHISQLHSPTVNPATILDAWEDPRTSIREFHNSKLGKPYADIQQKLTEAAIMNCVTIEAPRLASDGPCWAGVDVGKNDLFVCVGTNPFEGRPFVRCWQRIQNFTELHDISRAFNVHIGVVDAGAETRTVRDFVAKNHAWWGCIYLENRQDYLWDPKEKMITVNRTESLDASHKHIVDQSVSFPRKNAIFLEEVVPSLKNLVRVVEEEKDTGRRRAKWIRSGTKRDDFRHAFNLAMIAALDCPVEFSTRRVRQRGRRGGRTTHMSA